MHKAMSVNELANFGPRAMYGVEIGADDFVVVADYRAFYGEYAIERGGYYAGMITVYSNSDLQKCVNKMNQIVEVQPRKEETDATSRL